MCEASRISRRGYAAEDQELDQTLSTEQGTSTTDEDLSLLISTLKLLTMQFADAHALETQQECDLPQAGLEKSLPPANVSSSDAVANSNNDYSDCSSSTSQVLTPETHGGPSTSCGSIMPVPAPLRTTSEGTVFTKTWSHTTSSGTDLNRFSNTLPGSSSCWNLLGHASNRGGESPCHNQFESLFPPAPQSFRINGLDNQEVQDLRQDEGSSTTPPSDECYSFFDTHSTGFLGLTEPLFNTSPPVLLNALLETGLLGGTSPDASGLAGTTPTTATTEATLSPLVMSLGSAPPPLNATPPPLCPKPTAIAIATPSTTEMKNSKDPRWPLPPVEVPHQRLSASFPTLREDNQQLGTYRDNGAGYQPRSHRLSVKEDSDSLPSDQSLPSSRHHHSSHAEQNQQAQSFVVERGTRGAVTTRHHQDHQPRLRLKLNRHGRNGDGPTFWGMWEDERARMIYVSWLPRAARAGDRSEKKACELALKEFITKTLGFSGLQKVLLFPPSSAHCKLLFESEQTAVRFLGTFGGTEGDAGPTLWKLLVCQHFSVNIRSGINATRVRIIWADQTKNAAPQSADKSSAQKHV